MNGRWPKAELKGTQKLAENEVKGEKKKPGSDGQSQTDQKRDGALRPPTHYQYQQSLANPLAKRAQRQKAPTTELGDWTSNE